MHERKILESGKIDCTQFFCTQEVHIHARTTEVHNYMVARGQRKQENMELDCDPDSGSDMIVITNISSNELNCMAL